MTCPMLVAARPVPLIDTALTKGGGLWGQLMQGYIEQWSDPANAANEEPLQRDWEEEVNPL